jgi:hypothetical protein
MTTWGVGLHSDILAASLLAVVSAVNRFEALSPGSVSASAFVAAPPVAE